MLIIIVLAVLVALSAIIYMVNKDVGFIAMQVSVALVIVYATYLLSLFILRRDRLIVDDKFTYDQSSRTLVIDGVADTSSLQRTVVDALNPASLSYAKLPRSLNRKGGAQFTYQFWMLIDNPASITYQDILLRGDPRPYNLATVDASGELVSQVEDIMIKCPRIRFNGMYNELAVEINTLNNPNPPPLRIETSNASDELSSVDRQSILKLSPNRWVLYTFIFQDKIQINDFESGIQMSFYVNDVLHSRSVTQSTLRQNNGNLYLFPSGPIDGCKIANLAYYNYALSTEEIAGVYNRGVPSHMYTKNHGASMATPLYLTEYNKLNMYNA